MRLAPFVWSDDRTTAEQLRILLAKHIPDSKSQEQRRTFHRHKPDLRGFEWHYYQHLLESSAAVFSGHGVSVVGGAFTSNGQLVTLDQNGQVRRWDLDSQDEDEASRRDLPGGPSRSGPRSCRPTDGWPRWPKGTRFTFLTRPRAKRRSRSIPPTLPVRASDLLARTSDRLVIVDDKIRWCNAASGQVIASFDQEFDRREALAWLCLPMG